MKNYLMILAILLLASQLLPAQNSETIRVKAADDVAVSDHGIYRFPLFVNATVFFIDGKLVKALMNYNMLNNQMLYIDNKGDTLAIAVPEAIKKIELNDTLFYNNENGWLENIAGAVDANLVVRRKIAITYKKEGAFGTSNSTNAIDSYNNYTVGNTSYRLSAGGDVTLKKMTSYFLLTPAGVLLPASKSNFLSQFAKKKSEIQNYLVANKVNFNKEQDLVRLLAIANAGN